MLHPSANKVRGGVGFGAENCNLINFLNHTSFQDPGQSKILQHQIFGKGIETANRL